MLVAVDEELMAGDGGILGATGCGPLLPPVDDTGDPCGVGRCFGGGGGRATGPDLGGGGGGATSL